MANRRFKSLRYPDNLRLLAAQGWVELGNHAEAEQELEQIKPRLHSHPDVLEVRWHIYAHVRKWDTCVDVATQIIQLAPKRSFGWIYRSFALHELQRTQEAFDQLLAAADRFPTLWTIPYNLACYCAQRGRFDQCQEWFNKAMAIDERPVKRAAIEDPDLKTLWKSMSNAIWKR